jgi:hypothetical protein
VGVAFVGLVVWIVVAVEFVVVWFCIIVRVCICGLVFESVWIQFFM